MRADSATVASVWSRNTTTKISASDASSAASGAQQPVGAAAPGDDPGHGARRRRAAGPARSAPGARASRRTWRRRSRPRPATAGAWRSRSRRASRSASVPNAMSGSGRRPLLNGSHAARNTAPAVHTATRLAASGTPEPGQHAAATGSASVPMPARVAGSRIHTPAVLTDGEVGEHGSGTSRTAPRWCRSSGSSSRRSRPVRRPARWSGCSRRRRRSRRSHARAAACRRRRCRPATSRRPPAASVRRCHAAVGPSSGPAPPARRSPRPRR